MKNLVNAAIEDGTREYTNSKGFKVILRGIPPLEIPLLYNSIVQPDKPTYTVEIAGGDSQTFPHEVDDAKGINTLSTDEDRAAWNKYIALKKAADDLLAERISTAALMDGVDINQEALKREYPRWEKRMKLKGLPVPDDEDDKELLFKRTFVVADTKDLKNILDGVMQLSQVQQELIESTKDSFPDNMESKS